MLTQNDLYSRLGRINSAETETIPRRFIFDDPTTEPSYLIRLRISEITAGTSRNIVGLSDGDIKDMAIVVHLLYYVKLAVVDHPERSESDESDHEIEKGCGDDVE